MTVEGGQDKTSSRDLEAETEAEITGKQCSALKFTFSFLSYMAQAHLPKGGTAHSGLGPPPSISKQANALQTCPQANLMEATLQLSLPLLRHVKLTAKISHQNFTTVVWTSATSDKALYSRAFSWGIHFHICQPAVCESTSGSILSVSLINTHSV